MTAVAEPARPTPDDVLDAVRELLAVVCERPAASIDASTRLADLGADSLALVALAELLEERFATVRPGLHIADDDLAAFHTAGDAVGYLVARL